MKWSICIFVIAVVVLIAAFSFKGYERLTSLDEARELHVVGKTHYDDSDYHLGLKPLKTAFQIRQKYLGSANTDTVNTAEFLLSCLDSNGDTQEALSFAKDYLQEIARLVGEENYQYARIETLLGNVQAGMKEYEQAIESQRHARKVTVAVKGKKNRDSFLTMHNLNLTLAQAGHVEEAISGEEELLSLKREILGPKDRQTIKSITNLAFSLSKRGDHERAKNLHEESLKLRREVFGERHPETYLEMVNLGICYNRLGRLEEGIELCRKGYDFFLSYYPEGHPDIRWAALNLRNLLSFTDRDDERVKLTQQYDLEQGQQSAPSDGDKPSN